MGYLVKFDMAYRNEIWEVTDTISCIKLTQNKYALIDTKDLPLVIEYTWYAHKNGNTFYAETSVKKKKNKTSKYPGVCWNMKNSKWISNIRIGDKIRYLGSFYLEEDANQAYIDACTEADKPH